MGYSIVMPVYKRLEVIEFALKSVLDQSLSPIELIIVDNNTQKKDIFSLKKLIESLKGNYSHPIVYIKSPKNSGALARNLGAKIAKGEFVAFLDSDVILDKDYYEILLKYFYKDNNLIGIQGLDRSLLENNSGKSFFSNMVNIFEQFFETSVLFNRKKSFVSPSLAVSHPNLNNDFETNTEWISTCAGIFKRSLFDKYKFPEQFITYSNNEYIMFSYNLYKKLEGTMIYTSKAKYRDIQTSSGRINRVKLMFQTQTYDLYIFLRLFDLNFINLLIYIKSRIGYLIYYLSRLIIKKNFSLKYYLYSFGSIVYPLFNLKNIIKGDLTFYERDFPIE